MCPRGYQATQKKKGKSTWLCMITWLKCILMHSKNPLLLDLKHGNQKPDNEYIMMMVSTELIHIRISGELHEDF